MSRKWVAIGWMTVIFLTSCTVVSSKQFVHAVATHTPITVSESGFQAFWRQCWWVFVKGYHGLEFALLYVLLARAWKPGWQAVLASVIWAGLDEFHQTFVPNRGGRLTDVLIDTGGIFVAAGVVNWWSWRRDRRKPVVER